MNKLLVATSLYIGLAFAFATNALLIVQGASVLTAMVKGLTVLLVFASLGIVAGVVARGKPVLDEDSTDEETETSLVSE
ncbi:MAG TPA: hypothetical protein VHS28_05435 [Chloroflexota bacterium]|nr:hypothetical protein [Chloroflexota bacterium]